MEGVTDESATAAYVERSIVPLIPQGWTTFRRIGCFSREEEPDPQDHNYSYPQLSLDESEPVELTYSDHTPEGCAEQCSVKMGGGMGFFGISRDE